ncbi:hypothetical protein LMH87_011553 [Akanthomyces muscarius]|uniref:Uncharacterized protein n=1 Tax=Akanthomyces muscarius TaxID=2231603 RepID=A0A9W8Q9Y6_AKAMU|nr:hypothetical protein LMH87_011553 [Akanthomyces muscarius]KAJ4150820.1 hypothetical protein LMH87_011553 [Akanthomyces muscarius]
MLILGFLYLPGFRRGLAGHLRSSESTGITHRYLCTPTAESATTSTDSNAVSVECVMDRRNHTEWNRMERHKNLDAGGLGKHDTRGSRTVVRAVLLARAAPLNRPSVITCFRGNLAVTRTLGGSQECAPRRVFRASAARPSPLATATGRRLRP